jgi:hypothetical protein
MEDLHQEMHPMFRNLAQELRATLPSTQAPVSETLPTQQPETEYQWEDLLEDIPQAPALSEDSWPKVFKLAWELRRRASLMTAGRDLHGLY